MKKAATKVDLVYDYLLHEILSGCYANGSHILIQDVAQACSVSPTPVREALRRLESNLASAYRLQRDIAKQSLHNLY